MAGWSYNQLMQNRLFSLDNLRAVSMSIPSLRGNKNTKKQIHRKFLGTHNQRTLMINPALIIIIMFFFPCFYSFNERASGQRQWCF